MTITQIEKIHKYEGTQDDWDEFITVMNSGDRFEVDEEMFDYWLGVLPPVFMNRYIDFLPGHEGHKMLVAFGFAEGADNITVFFRSPDGKKFYGHQTSKIARGW
jgi:hypothetical protein